MASTLKKTILLADDDDDLREIFSLKISAAGFIVETASDGQDAYEKAKKIKPDLAVLDVNMPHMDGIEAFLKIREDPDLKNLRAVFLTSYGDKDHGAGIDEKTAKEMGALGYIKKTDDLNEIVGRIKNFANNG